MKQRLCCSRTESFNSFFYNYLLIFVRRGDTLVDPMPLDRKVVGSTPILAATPGTSGKSFTNSIYIMYCIHVYCKRLPVARACFKKNSPLHIRPKNFSTTFFRFLLKKFSFYLSSCPENFLTTFF